MFYERQQTPSPRWAMIEDSAEEFLTTSSGEGCFGLPSLGRHNTGAPPTPVTTTPWTENAPAIQALMTVPPRMAAPWLDTGLPSKQWRTHQEGQRAQAHAQQPDNEQEASQP
jgi:hypothetical protein